jgi:acetyl-CoA carboxylase biotin carboxyl carrier protein
MDFPHIAGLVDLFERSTLLELEYSENDSRLRLSRSIASSADTAVAPQSKLSNAIKCSTPARPSSEPPFVGSDTTVAAGLTGTFFRCPSPDQPPFVSLGDTVEEGQMLGIIEAMKTLNAVEAECGGTISSIVCEDGTSVDAGSILFTIAPIGSTNV